jgi:hypothetical protein
MPTYDYIKDLDPAFHFDVSGTLLAIKIRFRIHILFLFKVIEICDHWSTDHKKGSKPLVINALIEASKAFEF